MLTISRLDVPSDRIVDYPVNSRFIKIPISNYLSLLNLEPIPSQIALINAINNPKYRFVTAALSRRQGKTYIANIIAQLIVLVPSCNILIVSPNYSLSQISFELQRKLIKHFDLEVERDNAKDKVIELSNGSTIRMGSVAQVDSCVGRSYDLIVFDEAALSAGGRDAFNVALMPTLDKPNSKSLFISTPRGKVNWFADFYGYGFLDSHPQWCSIRATWEANPRMSQEVADTARQTMSAAEFAQEYEADFCTFEGQIWNFSASNVLTDIDIRDLEVYAGLDVGFRDPTAMCVIGYSYSEDIYYILDEYTAAAVDTAVHAAEISRLVAKWNIQRIFIDSAAAQTRWDLAQLYGISSSPAKKDVLAGIAYVATIVETDRLKVASHCTGMLACLDNYQWDTSSATQKPLHNMSSHYGDSLRYCVFTLNASKITF